MNNSKHLNELYTFLNTYKDIHQQEMIVRDLVNIPSIYLDWASQLSKLTLEELSEFESDLKLPDHTSSSLKNYAYEIKELTSIAHLNLQADKVNENLLRKISLKKSHEVETLSTFITQNIKEKTFLDVGSGAGHLSNNLVFRKDLKAYCLDISSEFQTIGKKKIDRWIPDNKHKITFINKDFFKFNLKEINSDDTLIIGLHSCGGLSNQLIKKFVNSNLKSLINFGCCYYKLNPNDFLSDLLNSKPQIITKESLFLAERTTSYISAEDILRRKNVKKFRYAYHLFLKNKNGSSFESIGNSSKSLYSGDFASYFYSNFLGNEIFSRDELNKFVYSKDFLACFNIYFALDSLRFVQGRLIELMIALDRAQYINDNNIKTQVFTLFDPRISPRNICIYAFK